MIEVAISMCRDGNVGGAIRSLNELIESGEDDQAVYSTLAQIYYELGDYASAAAAYGEIVAAEPLHATAHFHRAICEANLEDWKAASDSFHNAYESDRTRADALYGLGVAQLRSGNPAQALATLERFLSIFPAHEEGLYSKAVALYEVGRLSECVRAYRDVLAQNPRREDALTRLIAIAMETGDLESTRRYAAMLAEIQPQSAVAIEAFGYVAMADGDCPTAVRHYRALCDVDPNCSEHWFTLGRAIHSSGALQEAAEAYRHAIKLDPTSAEAYMYLGATYHERGDLAVARMNYERAMAIAPRPSLYWNMALLLEAQRDFDGAQAAYSKIPDDAEEAVDAWFQLGHLHLIRRQYADGAQFFEACVAKRPTWYEAWVSAGMAYQLNADWHNARRCHLQSLKIRPNCPHALRCLAELALEERNWDEAYELYCRLIESGEHDAELCYNIALICQKRELYKDAVLFYRQALDEKPEFVAALLNLGHVLMTLGQEREARACWSKAISQKPELAETYSLAAATA
jgi:tetratricopeptide (TPR) repeat protein